MKLPSVVVPHIDLQTTFEAIPGNHVILLSNAPTFTIVGATDTFLKTSYNTRENILGRPLFEVFPDDTTNEKATGVLNLRSSLEYVIAQKETHQMADQRYDIVNPETGSFEVKVWAASNKPVVNSEGAVQYIIHTTEDITERVRLQEESNLRLEQYNESESRFRRMVEQAPVPILLSRGEEVVVESLNEPMLRLMNKTCIDDVVGKKIVDALPELKDQEVLQIVKSVQKTGVPFQGNEVPTDVLIEGKLERLYFNYSYTPLMEGGKIKGVLHVALDITQQVSSRKKIEESEERFRSMADASPVMIWTLDENGNSTYYNSRAREFTGHTKKDLEEGKSWQVSIHPDDIEMAGSVVSNAINNRVPYQMECRMMRVDEEWRWLLNHGTPRFGKEGEFFGFVGSSIDITERKHSEQALKESESRFRALVNASSDVIYRLNADWSIMYPLDGRGFLSDAQAPVENWMEKNVHPSEYTLVKRTIASAIANKSVFELEHRVVTADGATGWTFSRAIPLLDDRGNILEWFGTASDITARKEIEQALKESERRFRSLADQSPIFVFIIEPDPLAPVNYWNKTWLDYTGQSMEEARGRAWEGIIHPDDLHLMMETYLTSFKTEQPYFIPAVRTKRYDGVYRWHMFKGNPRFGADGNFNGYVGVGFDVHEQKMTKERLEFLVKERTKELAEANQTLQQINKELQRSNQNLEEFAHAASHDLKEPVRKIHFFTNQLKDQLNAQLQESQARAFDRIENATERMGNLIDDLLLYSHVSQRPHETEPVDLNKKVQKVLEDLELDVEEKKAMINIGKLPVIKGYRRQLQQLFQNLISNALKYSKADIAPHIHISASEVSENGRRYHLIAIKDNGIGFAQEHEEKIFQMFTRLHGRAEYSGTGVGLSIVKKVVENHNGLINVESKPGEGATFKVLIPAE